MIIYHGGIIGFDVSIVSQEKINILISFAKDKKHEWKPWWKNLFIDSGAFSVHKSGKIIQLKEYIDYIKKWKDTGKPIVYASLDVIGDEKESYKNYKYLLKKKLNPMPCFHYGEDFEVLKKYAEMTNYIGLGALVGVSTKKRRIFLDRVFEKYPDPEKIGFHGFGITTKSLLTDYPWRSVDSTSAMSSGANGNIMSPFGQIILNKTNDKNILDDGPTSKRIKKWLFENDISYERLLSDNRYSYNAKMFLSAKTLDEFAKKNKCLIYNSKTNYFDIT